MRYLAGVDGCRGGWVVVSKDLDTGEVSWRVCENVRQIVSGEIQPLVTSIDIPIGLMECGPRQCDLEARHLLGVGRGSCVFPGPIRPVLAAIDYRQACRIRQEIEGKKMSKQAWNITGKIREVDDLLRQDPSMQDRLREVHPEVCFYFMAGGYPLVDSKRTAAGGAIRLSLLSAFFGERVQAALVERVRLSCAADDILDAFAALWTAERIFRGEAVRLPEDPSLDSAGLRMEIVA